MARTLRLITALILVFAAIGLFIAPPPPLRYGASVLWVWLALAFGIGFLLGRWWALLLASLPLLILGTGMAWHRLHNPGPTPPPADGLTQIWLAFFLFGLLGLAFGALLGWRPRAGATDLR
jgi:hypothetical protein